MTVTRTILVGIVLAVLLELLAVFLLWVGTAGPCGPTDLPSAMGFAMHTPCLLAGWLFTDGLELSDSGHTILSLSIQVTSFCFLTVPLALLYRAIRITRRLVWSQDQPNQVVS